MQNRVDAVAKKILRLCETSHDSLVVALNNALIKEGRFEEGAKLAGMSSTLAHLRDLCLCRISRQLPYGQFSSEVSHEVCHCLIVAASPVGGIAATAFVNLLAMHLPQAMSLEAWYSCVNRQGSLSCTGAGADPYAAAAGPAEGGPTA